MDWIRDENGYPKQMPNGAFVLQKASGVCLAVFPEDVERFVDLADEIEISIPA